MFTNSTALKHEKLSPNKKVSAAWYSSPNISWHWQSTMIFLLLALQSLPDRSEMQSSVQVMVTWSSKASTSLFFLLEVPPFWPLYLHPYVGLWVLLTNGERNREGSWLRKLSLSLVAAAQWPLRVHPPMGWSTPLRRSVKPIKSCWAYKKKKSHNSGTWMAQRVF